MSGCLLAGAMMLILAGDEFRLEWVHSVENVAWREFWRISDGMLVLTGAAIKGSGAGMEPGPDAELRDGWWVWQPHLQPQRQLLLAASGDTQSPWTLCDPFDCFPIGEAAGPPVSVRPCP